MRSSGLYEGYNSDSFRMAQFNGNLDTIYDKALVKFKSNYLKNPYCD